MTLLYQFAILLDQLATLLDKLTPLFDQLVTLLDQLAALLFLCPEELSPKPCGYQKSGGWREINEAFFPVLGVYSLPSL